MIKKCSYCEKEFEIADWDARRGRGKFCGRDCFNKSRIGVPRPDLWRRETKECVICGKKFETGGRLGKRDLYCSRICQAKGRMHNSKVRKMSDIDAAYLAGLIDGEGSILISQKREMRNTWRLQVSNTDFGVLSWVKETTGIGSIFCHKHENPKWKDAGIWQCYSWNARKILKQLMPYLKIGEKIQRAESLIAELDAIEELNK